MAGSIMVPAIIQGPVMWRLADYFEMMDIEVDTESGPVVVAEWYINGILEQYIVQIHTHDDQMFALALAEMAKNVSAMRESAESYQHATIH